MKTVVFDCSSGISGDMTVAALLSLGADETVLREGLASLPVDGYRLEISETSKCGIAAKDFDVILEQGHSHAHTHAEEDYHDHEHHSHGDDGHTHGQEHEHHHAHAHPHEHRNLHDIIHIINHGAITPRAKELAIKMFTIVAEAESKAHGLPVEQVHFHEVGAIDSIVDLVGAAICLDNLGIEKVYCSGLSEGTGTVKCAHGIMPVPVPAVMNVVSSHNIPLRIINAKGEMVTPTGAAIIAAVCNRFELPETMVVKKTGIGAGKKDFPHANILRVLEVETQIENSNDTVVLLEANIDDQTPEQLSYAMERLFADGALDVWFEPITMKKNRPANKLCVLCSNNQKDVLVRTILRHTSSIGVRYQSYQRIVMGREIHTVTTKWGKASVKMCRYNGIEKATVEYETAKALADASDIPLQEVYREILKSYNA